MIIIIFYRQNIINGRMIGLLTSTIELSLTKQNYY